ncbi:MAG: ATP-dependent Clp protease proteolytic subunit [Oscillospiraceae bacterium]|nr:ATP-dependent Clp protease proteolytic subunit [Oscillospiraceae bacterium]
MEQSVVDSAIKEALNNKILKIEEYFNADALEFCGSLIEGAVGFFKKHIENLKIEKDLKETLIVILTTNGGSAQAVIKIVNILRHHYKKVIFIVPNFAYSAGTLLCMSGDDIYMDYSSVLGPIDPQIQNKEGRLVPALNYLDKVNELIEKAKNGTLTDAEFVILKEFDVAELRDYEQARDLAVDLLKKWLVEYKFKNWILRESSQQKVTLEYKNKRAEEIAIELGNTSKWHTHSYPIDVKELSAMKLKIENYSQNNELKGLIDSYYNMLSDYIRKNGASYFIHTRRGIEWY